MASCIKFLVNGVCVVFDYEGSSDPTYIRNILRSFKLNIDELEIFGLVDEETGEYVMEVGEYQVRAQECLVAESSCLGTSIDRCFSLENIDGVWHLDYNLIDNATLDQAEIVEVDEAAEVVVPVETVESVEAEI